MKGCRALTNEECTLIKNTLNTRDRCLFVLGIRTGYRINELLSLLVSDVVNESGDVVDTIKVRKASMKGKGESRAMPLHPECKEALRAWLKKCRNGLTEPLFKSTEGRGSGGGRLDASVFRKKLKGTARAHSIRDVHLISSHSMRKTFATNMRKIIGPDLFLLQQLMGHKSPSSTVAYLSFDQEEVWNVIRKMK